MISEELQDQAALYALGSLDASEAAAFKSAMNANAELHDLVREFRDAVGALAHHSPLQPPPPGLRQQVLARIAAETKRAAATEIPVERSRGGGWLPWAIAALLLIGCILFVVRQQYLRKDLAQSRANEGLLRATIVAMAPTPEGTRDATATVAWDASRQKGVIRISHLPPAGAGKDYQLWAVDADRGDPLDAGIVRVDPTGVARAEFKTGAPAQHVKAFALSLERKGGVPKREGPIVLIGSL